VAHYLIEKCQVKPDKLIGICLERSIELVVGILGILKAGGAYVPIDVNYPESRISYMLDNSGVDIILIQEKLKSKLPVVSQHLLSLDGEEIEFLSTNYSTSNPVVEELNQSNLAYMNYTSGSTGQPKGVLIEHIGVVRLVLEQDFMPLNHETVFLQCANISFDAITLELWGPLLNGGRCVLYAEKQIDLDKLNESINKYDVNSILLTSGLFTQWSNFVSGPIPSLEYVLAGGDVLSVEAVKTLSKKYPEINVINAYGPTENTTISSCYKVNAETLKNTVPIGKPLMGDEAYVVDFRGALQPAGVVGELVVGGDGLAREYLNIPELTAEKFIKNPFYNADKFDCSKRLYRTGDLVRYLPDGNLEFVGRVDDQVKIRGFRIELGEVENKLAQYEQIGSCVVVVRKDNEEKNLVAYVVPSAENRLDNSSFIAELREKTQHELPTYMHPSAWVILEILPLTITGKVDQKKLPKPDMIDMQSEYVSATTKVESQLVDIWANLLNLEPSKLSVTANFFELGGHSLLSVRLISAVRAEFNVEVSLAAMFNNPFIQDMAALIESGGSEKARSQVLAIPRKTNQLPVSFSQQRLWFIDNLQGGSSEYNMPGAFNVSGTLSLSIVTQVISTIIDRHEILRTVYIEKNGEILQHIREMSEITFSISEHNLSDLNDEEQQSSVNELIVKDARELFNLKTDLMVRASYICLGQKEGVLLFNTHHIASDGWSTEILIKEFFTLYHAYVQGKENPLPALGIQYVDYAQWQREWLQGEVLEAQLSYWDKQLDDIPSVHQLTLDKPRPNEKRHQGAVVSASLPAEVAQSLNELGKQHGLTSFMLMHSALSLMLSRHSNTHDIVIGTPVANRMQVELEPLIGFFVNTLVLRLNTNYSMLEDYLAHVRQVNLDAQANQDVSFEQLVERLNVSRDTAFSPLFQIMLVTNTDYGLNSKQDEQSFTLPDVSLSMAKSDFVQAKFDLNINMDINEKGVNIDWTYDLNLFTETHIEQFSEHLCRVLTELSTLSRLSLNEYPAINELAMLSLEETDYQLKQLNNTQADYPEDKCFHELFEAQVSMHGDKVALIFEEEELTYQQLNERANQVAHNLIENHKVQPEALVGLCVNRSFEMVIGILGILKAGAAYVPLDPELPQARIDYMLDDAAINLVLTQQKFAEQLTFKQCDIVSLNTGTLTGYSDSNVEHSLSGIDSSNLAYVIYTSGSTGMPKGVLIEHANVASFNHIFTNQLNKLNVTNFSPWLWSASFAFDASIKGLLSLTQGRPVILMNDKQSKEPKEVVKFIEKYKVEVYNAVPGLLELVIEELNFNKSAGIQIISSGDQISATQYRLFKAYTKYHNSLLLNAYGPTETTVNCTDGLINEQLNIGRAADNINSFVLNEQLGLAPLGAVGELYISGAGVARGYLNNPDLTKERFIQNPYYDNGLPDSHRRLYKTGDLVRYLGDGTLKFLGRIDEQVQIRGYRIELGEIEYQLNQQDSIESSVVLAREIAGSQQLVAYVKAISVVSDETLKEFNQELKLSLGNQLPDYMIPNAIVMIKDWPLTISGKLNRNALPDPSCKLEAVVAATTNTESVLIQIWARLLQCKDSKIGITTNFFESGGHSLLLVRLVSAIRAEFDVELSLAALFNNPLLKDMAVLIDSGDVGAGREQVRAIDRETNKVAISFAQQRLWFIDNLQGGSAEYNMPAAFNISGDLNISIVTQVFSSIIERHEILRTVYIEEGGEVLQQIRDMSEIDYHISEYDLSGLSGDEQKAAADKLIVKDAHSAFNLKTDLMVRAGYINLGNGEGTLFFNTHHIASDGWSTEVLIKEFFTLYHAYVEGKANPLPALAIQYADYAQWQRNWLQGEVLEKQLSYWEKQLADIPAVHSLTLDKSRGEVKQHQGAVVSSRLPAEVAQSLVSLTKRHNLTPFMLMHAALSLVLSRHSNSQDIVIGTPVANRMQVELEPLIGFFVNTLVLRLDTSFSNLEDYFAHVRQVNLDAQSHQDVSFEQLVDRLKVSRSTAFTPLFQIMLTTNTDYGLNSEEESQSFSLPGVTLSPVTPDVIPAKFDLDVSLDIHDKGLEVGWTYDANLFTEAHIEQLNGHLCRLLRSLADLTQESAETYPEIKSLEMLSAKEALHQVEMLNGLVIDYPKEQCIHELFEAQVLADGEKVALVFGEKELTYRELNERANQVAHYLVENHAVKPDSLVGICVKRSLDMAVGILGILKAGGAYVPLDPEYPQVRLDYMLEDAGLGLVVTQTELSKKFESSTGEQVCLDSEVFNHYPVINLDRKSLGLEASHLAYMLYTSGSTGQPKGVMIEHGSLLNFNVNIEQRYQIDIRDCVLQFSTVNFDIFVEEFFGALSHGAKLILMGEWSGLDTVSFVEFCNHHGVNIASLPTAFWHQLNAEEIQASDSLRLVILGGEALQRNLVEEWLEHCEEIALINSYGPTECTVTATSYHVEQSLPNCQGIPIGQVNANGQAMILNDSQSIVPEGAVGELYLGGPGLARGYFNQPELTQSRFIDNPYSELSDARLYQTGDLVRYLPCGNLEFVGRVDEQLKINGFRIETGEIEYQLSQCYGVESAHVLAKKDAQGSQQLVAYVKNYLTCETVEDKHNAIREIKLSLRGSLPAYMLPSLLIIVDNWPITINGKLDKEALPEIDESILQLEYVAPKTKTETILTEIWSTLLMIDANQISCTLDFFELGGNSLGLMSLVNRINERFNVRLAVRDLYKNLVITELASLIDSDGKSEVNNNSVVKISSADKEANLFLIHPFMGTTDCYQPLAKYFENDLNIYGLNATYDYQNKRRYNSLIELAANYLERIKQVQPRGPYRLGGWSMGGIIAYYVAVLLKYQNQEVEFLTMMDSEHPVQFVKTSFKQALVSVVKNIVMGNENGFEQFEKVINSDEEDEVIVQKVTHQLMSSKINLPIPNEDIERVIRFSIDFSLAQKPLIPLSPKANVQLVVPEAKEDKEKYIDSWKNISTADVSVFDTPTGHWEIMAYTNVGRIASILKKGMKVL
jgi:amino acid adenylation domain-containing protein